MNLTTKIFKTCQAIFTLFLIYFAIQLLLYHFYLVIYPYPAMLREGAMMTNTDALVKGLNPYSMLLQPQYANEYGIIYPLLVWPLAKIFGTTMLVHRFVTAFFILCSCSLIFFVLKKIKTPLLLNIWAVLMLYASLLYPGTSTPCIDPGSTGMFFLLATIFVPWFCQYSYRSLLISVLCGILAFYTKQYTMLGIPVMASYLFFFVSKGKGVFYGSLWLLLALISVLGINQALPAYFDNCFFSVVNMGPAWSSMNRLYMQVHLYAHLHAAMLILIGVVISGYVIKALYNNSWGWGNLKENITALYRNIKLNSFNDPLIKINFPLVLYSGLCASFVLYISLGRHTGATLWYFFQLLSPFLLIAAAWLFSRPSFWPVLCIPFLIYNLYVMTADTNYKLFRKNLLGWPQISTLISQHQHILNISLIAPILVEQNKEVTDNGMSEYFMPGGKRTSWMKYFFKDDPRVLVQQILFFGKIRAMLQDKEFDLVILQPTLLPLGVGDDVRKFYKYEGLLMLYASQDRRPYAVAVWRPL